MCSPKLKGRKRDISLINIHAPTKDKNIDENSEFYERLEELFVGLPNHYINIVLSDCNFKSGQGEGYEAFIRKKAFTKIVIGAGRC